MSYNIDDRKKSFDPIKYFLVDKESELLGFDQDYQDVLQPSSFQFEHYGCQKLSEVLAWNHDVLKKSSTFEKCFQTYLQPKRVKREEKGPKVLFCHDYKYNYWEPFFVQTPMAERMEIYTFPYWSLIDIFVYFSHKLLSIPQPQWILASHKNGVPCFGTFLIEGWAKYENNGQETTGKDLINTFLSDIEMIENFVGAMIQISKFYKIDGWLINIETKIEKKLVPRMEYFLEFLKKEMRRLKKNQSSEMINVIWYDSVTIAGELKWQNELNELNEPFFTSSDAIFLNYTWTDKTLTRSVLNSQKREQDIFVGVDCYGRGCFGGGGYGCHLALEKILSLGLSVALFAPAWTYESKLETDHERSRENKLHQQWKIRHYWKNDIGYNLADEYLFWSLLAIQGRLLNHENLMAELPLKTNFNLGYGFAVYAAGKKISDRRWMDYGFTELMPSFFEPLHSQNNAYSLNFSFCDSFHGGSCLEIKMFTQNPSQPITLFRTWIKIFFKETKILKLQLLYKLINQSNESMWSKSLRFKVIIEYFPGSHSDSPKPDSSKIKRLVLVSHLEKNDQGLISPNQMFSINGWSLKQIFLKKTMFFVNDEKNDSIIVSSFQVMPYFFEMDFSSKIDRENPQTVLIGEFFCDHQTLEPSIFNY